MSSVAQPGPSSEARASSSANSGQCCEEQHTSQHLVCPVDLTHPRTWSEDRLRYWLRSSKIGRRYEMSLLKGTDGKNLLRWPLVRFVGLCDGNKLHGQYLYNNIREKIEKFERRRRTRVQQQALLNADRSDDANNSRSPTHHWSSHRELPQSQKQQPQQHQQECHQEHDQQEQYQYQQEQEHHQILDQKLGEQHRKLEQQRSASAARWADRRASTQQNLTHRPRSFAASVDVPSPCHVGASKSSTSMIFHDCLEFRPPPRSSTTNTSARAATNPRERLSARSATQHTQLMSSVFSRSSASRNVRSTTETARHSERIRERRQRANVTACENGIGSGETTLGQEVESRSGSSAWRTVESVSGETTLEQEVGSRSGSGAWMTVESGRTTFMSVVSWVSEERLPIGGVLSMLGSELALSPMSRRVGSEKCNQRLRNGDDDPVRYGAGSDHKANSEPPRSSAVGESACLSAPQHSTLTTTTTYQHYPTIAAQSHRDHTAHTSSVPAHTPPTRMKTGANTVTQPRRSARSPLTVERTTTVPGNCSSLLRSPREAGRTIPSHDGRRLFPRPANTGPESAGDAKLITTHRDELNRVMVNACQLEGERAIEREAEMHRARALVNTMLSRTSSEHGGDQEMGKCAHGEKKNTTYDMGPQPQDAYSTPIKVERKVATNLELQTQQQQQKSVLRGLKGAATEVELTNGQWVAGVEQKEQCDSRASGPKGTAQNKAGKASGSKLVASAINRARKTGVPDSKIVLSNSIGCGTKAFPSSRGTKAANPVSSTAKQGCKIVAPGASGRKLVSPASKQRAVASPTGRSNQVAHTNAVPSAPRYPSRGTNAVDTADEYCSTSFETRDNAPLDTHISVSKQDPAPDPNEEVAVCHLNSTASHTSIVLASTTTRCRTSTSTVERECDELLFSPERDRDFSEVNIPPSDGATAVVLGNAAPGSKIRSAQELAAVRLVQRQATQLLGLDGSRTADSNKQQSSSSTCRTTAPSRRRSNTNVTGVINKDTRVTRAARTLMSKETLGGPSECAVPSDTSKNNLTSPAQGVSASASPVLGPHEQRERDAVALVSRQARDVLGRSWFAEQKNKESVYPGSDGTRTGTGAAMARHVERTMQELDALSAEVKRGIALAAEKRERAFSRRLSAIGEWDDNVPVLGDGS